MTPEQMVQRLSRHFAIRFDDDQDQMEWFQDITEAFKGYDQRVLADAVKWIIANRKARTFPLVAEIKEACSKSDPYAAAPPPSQSRGPSKRAPDTPEAIAMLADARAWQKQIADQYGTMENYLKKTRHQWRSQFAPNETPSKQTDARRSSSFKGLSALTQRIVGDAE